MKCRNCPLSAPEGKEYCNTCELIRSVEGDDALQKSKKDIGPFEKRLAFVEERLVDCMDMLIVLLKNFYLYEEWMEQKKFRIEERESGRKPGESFEELE